jgi:hypothetical protein
VLPASSPATRIKRAQTPIVHHRTTPRANGQIASCESVERDSRKKPVLASADETRSRSAQKFFYCQKSRLRVRDTRFQAASIHRDDIIRLVIAE